MWTHKTGDAKRDASKTSDFTVWGPQAIKVPAGKFNTIPVHTRYVWQRNGKQVAKASSTTWYAIGVGVVKHVSDEGGEMRVTELKEFISGR